MRINKSELSKKIGQLKGIVPSRTTIEALKGVLCSDGYLIASDTNLTVKAKLEGMEEKTEPFIIPAKAFDFIGSLPDGELEVSVSKRKPCYQDRNDQEPVQDTGRRAVCLHKEH